MKEWKNLDLYNLPRKIMDVEKYEIKVNPLHYKEGEWIALKDEKRIDILPRLYSNTKMRYRKKEAPKKRATGVVLAQGFSGGILELGDDNSYTFTLRGGKIIGENDLHGDEKFTVIIEEPKA